jgi:hypothetical protein
MAISGAGMDDLCSVQPRDCPITRREYSARFAPSEASQLCTLRDYCAAYDGLSLIMGRRG